MDTNAHDERAQQQHDRERHDADDLGAQSADTLRAIVRARSKFLNQHLMALGYFEAMGACGLPLWHQRVAEARADLAEAEAALAVAQEEGR